MSGPPIVSSAHLASAQTASLSELEFGLIVASHAFHRWVVRCMGAAGHKELGPLDVLVLHSVNHREREKKLADLCFVLNVEDTHLVNYALKKLARLDLVEGRRRGKERAYAVTDAGRAACERYREVRDACLLGSVEAVAGDDEERFRERLRQAAELLRALSGLYDQAARSATSL